MDDLTPGYAVVKDRIAELVLNCESDLLARQVPACPDWSVRDLVSHMVGLIDSRLNATMPAGLRTAWSPDPEEAASGRDVLTEWTSTMVNARQDRELHELLREWDERTATLVSMAASESAVPAEIDVAGSLAMCLGDALVHWVDLCGALDAPVDTSDPLLVADGRVNAEGKLPIRLSMHELAPFTVEALDVGERWGDPEVAVGVQGSAFELWRSLTGRRSRQQVLQLDWQMDPEPYLGAFINGSYPEHDQYP